MSNQHQRRLTIGAVFTGGIIAVYASVALGMPLDPTLLEPHNPTSPSASPEISPSPESARSDINLQENCLSGTEANENTYAQEIESWKRIRTLFKDDGTSLNKEKIHDVLAAEDIPLLFTVLTRREESENWEHAVRAIVLLAEPQMAFQHIVAFLQEGIRTTELDPMPAMLKLRALLYLGRLPADISGNFLKECVSPEGTRSLGKAYSCDGLDSKFFELTVRKFAGVSLVLLGRDDYMLPIREYHRKLLETPEAQITEEDVHLLHTMRGLLAEWQLYEDIGPERLAHLLEPEQFETLAEELAYYIILVRESETKVAEGAIGH